MGRFDPRRDQFRDEYVMITIHDGDQSILRLNDSNHDIKLVYRLNTYPIIHSGFFHTLLNVIALTPLLERFEAEHGTLTSIALFIGRKYRPYPWNSWIQGSPG